MFLGPWGPYNSLYGPITNASLHTATFVESISWKYQQNRLENSQVFLNSEEMVSNNSVLFSCVGR